ncbi:MAG: Uma2 family endonuclease [Bacteroidota bacterium]
MAELAKKSFTVEDWLNLERETGEKYDYHFGEIHRVNGMAGGTYEHNTVSGNIYGELRENLRGSSCQAHNSEMKVEVKKNDQYVYPDASVTCGELVLSEKIQGCVCNPTLIVEVISDTSGDYDRGAKLRMYFELDSVVEYLLLEQKKAMATLFRRLDGKGKFEINYFLGLEAGVELKSIGQTIPMRRIYEGVNMKS